MGHYSSWTKEEVWDKTDWEGGVCGILGWGGPEVFEAFGPEAVEAAQQINEGLEFIGRLFDQFEKERRDSN